MKSGKKLLLKFLYGVSMLIGSSFLIAEQQNAVLVYAAEEQQDADFTSYDYTEGTEGITITSYSGNVSTLNVPSTLDGHTVVGLGERVFENNADLQVVVIPDTVTSIGAHAFNNCINLQEIKLPNGLEIINEYTFYCCKSLTEVVIPDSVTEIGSYAFSECAKLTSVILSKSLTDMGDRAFGNCDALTSIHIPKSLENGAKFGSAGGAFGYCDGLKEVTFEEGTTQVAEFLFKNCLGLEKIELPDTITVIGACAFESCTNLEEVKTSNSVTLIGTRAFAECNNLKNVELSSCLTEIRNLAFYNCTELTEIIIPNSVTEIGSSAFANCIELENVILSKNLNAINEYTFDGCILLSEIEIFDSVTEIGDYAFQNCKSLLSAKLAEGVTSIGSYSFYNCDSLTSIIIPNSVTSLGSYCFYSCDSLAAIDFGLRLTEIPSNAFNQCGLLTSIVLPYGLKNIQAYAFTNNPLLLSVTIPRSVTGISTIAFSGYEGLTIYGVAGTYAETYADTLEATFVAQEIQAETVQLNKEELTLNSLESEKLLVIVEPYNFTDAVIWKSSNTAVATVSEDGEVEAMRAGTAVITAIVGDKSASCEITVLFPVTSIYLDKYSLTMATNETYTLTATVNPAEASNKSLEWSSSDPSVATVTQDGLVTAVAKGTATITATAQDGSGVTRSCTVNVTRCNYICTTVEELESAHNYENDCTDSWTYSVSGAEHLNVTFDEATMLEDYFDYLYIYDGEENLVGEYTGAELAGVTVTVTGDTVVIQLNTDSAGNEWGFKVTEIASDLEAAEGITGFVSRLYTVILERSPDEAGLAEWVGYLQDGTFTGAEVAKGFIMSDEFLNTEMTNEEFVQILYNAFFGREADAEGLATWTGYLDDGYRKSFIFAGFANSEEFGALCEGYGVAAGSVPVTISEQQPNLSEEVYNIWLFVERMYTEVLERTPDMGGISEWAGYLQDGTYTGAEVASGFILSEEFLAKEMSNEDYVKIMYSAFFGREADPSGLETWVNALETDFTKEYVFAGFANSDEFGVLCESYGITRGEVEIE